MEKKPTQKQTILKHLKRSSITNLTCYDKYCFTDLAGIIRDLRDDGHSITMEYKKTKDGTKYGVYRLKK